MGSITDSFADLAGFLQSARVQPAPRAPSSTKLSESQVFTQHFLKPWLPSSLRIGPGAIFDPRDRMVGPYDIVGASDLCPPVGEGGAARYPLEGVLFSLNIRDWAKDDLSAFGASVADLKKLERKNTMPPLCAAATFDLVPLSELAEFFKAPEGQSIDAVLVIGHHLIVRNTNGFYGDTQRVPVVSERGAGPALKAFAFLLLKWVTSSLRLPFPMTDYQQL
jgi:hypothetical protein